MKTCGKKTLFEENTSKTEELFLKALNKMEEYEDPLKIFLDYLKWLEENKKDSATFKIFEVLERMTKTFYKNQKYKQDERFLKKWIAYANMCSDCQDVLTFMKDNEIGLSHAMFYEVFAIIYEKKRDFQSANKILLLGLQKKASPSEKVNKLVKEFEDRMIQRIERDFYSQGKNLKETDTPPNFISNSTKKTENDNIKKRKFQDNEITKELPLKKTKFYEGKARETVKIGEINIFVDEQFRNQINISTQLVDEYLTLCKNYNFWKQINSNYPHENDSKPLSWITRENFLYKLEISENNSKNKNLASNQIFVKNMPKISEEDSFMASIEAINNNATKLANKKSLSEKNDEFFLKSDKKNNEAEKNNFIEYFSKKIEENIKDFFMISKLKPKPKPLNTSQKKNNISKVFSSNKNKSVKKITTLIKEEEKCLPQISFKLNFDEIKNNSSDKTDSLNVELDEIKNLSFDKISGFFSNEKEKLFGFSLKNDRNFDSAISDIEKVRNMEILNSESPKRNVHYTLNFESSFNDNAFLMDSNEENLSKDDLVNLLYLIEEKGVEKENILKIKNANERKSYGRKALQELFVDDFKTEARLVQFENLDEKNDKKNEKMENFQTEEEDFNDFFRNKVLNSGLSIITQRTKESS